MHFKCVHSNIFFWINNNLGTISCYASKRSLWHLRLCARWQQGTEKLWGTNNSGRMSHHRSIIRLRRLHPTYPHKNLARVQTQPSNNTERKPKISGRRIPQLVTHFSSTESTLQSHLFAHLCCISYQSDHEVTMLWWLAHRLWQSREEARYCL